MTGDDQRTGLDWLDGAIPVSQRFEDPYFSVHDGLAETRHVFLAGNDLPDRITPGFHIAELGFGTGLNLLATRIMLDIHPKSIRFTSFEAYPLTAAEITRALDHFPEASHIAGPFLNAWSAGLTRFDLGPIAVEVIVGDARETLPTWTGCADAWFLDGFSPAKNPELWSVEIMSAVAQHTASKGTFATYTAAGHVRRALTDAGFTVTRRPGHGMKRHMTTGILA